LDKEYKNPLLAGLINVLIPGSGQLFVNKDWGRFIRAFIISVLAFAAAIWTGNLVQHSRGYTLPQGMCMGILVMIVIAVLFLSGYKTAKGRNSKMKDAALYNSMRTVSRDSDAIKYSKIQKMREEGLISEKEYDEKNAKVASNRK